jgi:hypothetical protein
MPIHAKPKISVLPSGGGQAQLDPSDALILVLDHQSGLLQTVKDVPIYDLRRHVEMVAKMSALLNISVISTASEPKGPNGPLIPEIERYAPHVTYVRRKGEVKCVGQ